MVDSSFHVDFVKVIKNELEHLLPIDFEVDIFYQISQNKTDNTFVFLGYVNLKKNKRIDEGFVDNLQGQSFKLSTLFFSAEINQHHQ